MARLERLHPSRPAGEALMAFIEEKGVAGLPAPALISRAGLNHASAAAAIAELRGRKVVTEIGDLIVATAVLDERSGALMRAIEDFHKAQPLAPGIPREEARERLFGRAAPEVFEHVLGALARAGRLVARATLAAASHKLSFSDDEARARDALLAAFKTGGLTPPDARTAASAAGIAAAVSDRILKLLVREKALIRVDQMLFHADALGQLKADLQARKAGGETTLDVPLFKERYGISRKFAIPLLEYLDRERVTRRVGEGRVIL
jgi:selenocysteine-specific elongation factor